MQTRGVTSWLCALWISKQIRKTGFHEIGMFCNSKHFKQMFECFELSKTLAVLRRRPMCKTNKKDAIRRNINIQIDRYFYRIICRYYYLFSSYVCRVYSIYFQQVISLWQPVQRISSKEPYRQSSFSRFHYQVTGMKQIPPKLMLTCNMRGLRYHTAQGNTNTSVFNGIQNYSR